MMAAKTANVYCAINKKLICVTISATIVSFINTDLHLKKAINIRAITTGILYTNP